MCIICNCSEAGAEFLLAFESARNALYIATAKMRACAMSSDGEASRQYHSVHKKMVKLVRDWNRLEQEREHP